MRDFKELIREEGEGWDEVLAKAEKEKWLQ